ncbi:MAG: hypothetical protein AB2A00_39490 [Myxococcota bacterium]
MRALGVATVMVLVLAACPTERGTASAERRSSGSGAGSNGSGGTSSTSGGGSTSSGSGGGSTSSSGGPVPPGSARVRGTVWAPGNAPGMVPLNEEIPVSGAVVYATTSRPDAIPQEVYCEVCTPLPPNWVVADAKGHFSLSVAPGTFWLVIQKGQFRLEQQLILEEQEDRWLDSALTVLPSRHSPTEGMWIPRIAVAEGLWDNLEDILGKMQLGGVDASGYFTGTNGRFDLYINGSGDHADQSIADLPTLMRNLDVMRQYHIIFIPCSNGSNTELFNSTQMRENIRQYVALGGKLYVTDWSSEWMDVVFPEFIRFQSDHDTPGGATPSLYSEGDGTPGYDSQHGRAVDERLRAWLHGQYAPDQDGWGAVSPINASDFYVEGNWNHIQSLESVLLGYDPNNNPVYEQAATWVEGDWNDGGGMHPLTVTFEPNGCGRVLYSTYHTTEGHHAGLVPQERVLLFLIMELGECRRERPPID